VGVKLLTSIIASMMRPKTMMRPDSNIFTYANGDLLYALHKFDGLFVCHVGYTKFDLYEDPDRVFAEFELPIAAVGRSPIAGDIRTYRYVRKYEERRADPVLIAHAENVALPKDVLCFLNFALAVQKGFPKYLRGDLQELGLELALE
jgi:hypothetical protein